MQDNLRESLKWMDSLESQPDWWKVKEHIETLDPSKKLDWAVSTDTGALTIHSISNMSADADANYWAEICIWESHNGDGQILSCLLVLNEDNNGKEFDLYAKGDTVWHAIDLLIEFVKKSLGQ
jgi:hypothetical protein